MSRAGGPGNSINAKTEIPDESWEFIKFYGTTPGQTIMAESKAGCPTYRADPGLRKAFEIGNPAHDNVMLGVVEDRGGYGDHIRFYNETECRRLYVADMDLIYNKPYDEAAQELDTVLSKLEDEMNSIMDYGDSVPFPDLVFPFKPLTK